MISDTLDCIEHMVSLVFTDADNDLAIGGTNIEMGKQEKRTDSSGRVSFKNVSETESTLRVHSPCYNYISDLDITSDTTIHLSLQKTRYLVILQVIDKITETPVSEVSVIVQDSTLTTDPFFWPCGTYQLQILYDGYPVLVYELNLVSDTTLTAAIYTGPYPVTITVVDQYDHKEILAAEVVFGDEISLTDSRGEAVFTASPGSFPVSVRAENYASHFDTLQISDAGVSFEIPLKLVYAEAEFILSEQGTPVNNAIVTFNGESVLTNALGRAKFSHVEVGRVYGFTIRKDDYQTIEDSIQILHHTEAKYELVPTGTALKQDTELTIYPNPSGGDLIVESGERIRSIRVNDIAGRQVIKRNDIGAYFCTIKLEGLSEGMYFLYILLENTGKMYFRRIEVVQ